MKTQTIQTLVNLRLNVFTVAAICVVAIAFSTALPAQETSTPPKHHHYRAEIIPPDGGSDSFGAGYLFYIPFTDRGTYGASGDTATPGVNNSFTWTNGKQVTLEPLPQLPNLTGTNTVINWINQPRFTAGFGRRTDSITGVSLDQAAIWAPNGQIIPLSTPPGYQSHAVWINDFGQASGWIENSTPDPCAFGLGVQFQYQAVIWQFGAMRLLGTLGGTNSYGEFINNRGQVAGHSETSTTPDPFIGCPPIDPFIWQNGKMIDINPGNFGGGIGGVNFLNNRGQAVGFGLLYGDMASHPLLWDGEKSIDLFTVGNLGGSSAGADNVNEEGHVVGTANLPADQAFHPVLWRNGEFTDLGTVDGDDCGQPARINSYDQIVGASFPCTSGTSHAFLWENGEMVDLDMLIPSASGIQLTSADWITDDGKIAGQGVLTATGATRAVLLIPDGDCDQACEAAIVAAKQAPRASSNIANSSPLSPRTRAQLWQPRHRLN